MRNDMMLNRRILLVDDHRPIHEDFRSILTSQRPSAEKLDELESSFFGEPVAAQVEMPLYELESAFQGQEALEQVKAANAANRPFALAFMDVRMPPGWDGIETIQRIWEVDSEIQVVVCTAYADYSWEEMFKLFKDTDRLVFLRKPFDQTEVRQLACAMTSKWNSGRMARLKTEELEGLVQARTGELTRTVATLQEALENVKTLQGLVPICAHCKCIRDDKGFWSQVETYVGRHTNAKFSHSLCPDCIDKLYPEFAAEYHAKESERAAEKENRPLPADGKEGGCQENSPVRD